jgi:hypothetical protein
MMDVGNHTRRVVVVVVVLAVLVVVFVVVVVVVVGFGHPILAAAAFSLATDTIRWTLSQVRYGVMRLLERMGPRGKGFRPVSRSV